MSSNRFRTSLIRACITKRHFTQSDYCLSIIVGSPPAPVFSCEGVYRLFYTLHIIFTILYFFLSNQVSSFLHQLHLEITQFISRSDRLCPCKLQSWDVPVRIKIIITKKNVEFRTPELIQIFVIRALLTLGLVTPISFEISTDLYHVVLFLKGQYTFQIIFR